MTPSQAELLAHARESLDAAELLLANGHSGFAASRAYYAMFYLAEAFLEGKGLAFSKHAAVIAAFGREFAKTRVVPEEYHRYLLTAQALRHAGDYGTGGAVSAEDAQRQIRRALAFLDIAQRLLGPQPSS